MPHTKIEPTVLYIKKHNKTGKMYFGKTKHSSSVTTYTGSGKYWKRHLAKHGEDISTIWVSEEFTSKELINDFAELFSSMFGIVESKDWANLKEETGTDGGFALFGDNNPARRPEVKKKISEALKGHPGHTNTGFLGRTHTEESRNKIRAAHTGVAKSDEFRENLRVKSLARPSYNCIHCGRSIKSNVIRVHETACERKVAQCR